ncbi:MAG: hypothetical protein IJP66_08885, partial [Kiritimatiellae bacterium]|nr:hypothetical protein [Kiritimatiellia bacterium]
DEALEFVAPSVMGRQTGDPSLPYWGRLGRTWKWEETRQGFMNFRQHAIYLGSIPLMLALLSLLLLAASAGTGNAEHLFESQSPAFQIRRFKFDIVFWSVVWLVALLLAFGRYTPFYRLFSALPFVSYMRAPVKFVRLLEFSTAFLAAVGLDALSRGEGRRPLRRAAVVAAALAVAFGAFATLVAARPSVFLSPLAALGADATLMRLMGANAVRALTHAILGFGFFAAVAWWRSRRAGARAGGFAAVALAVFVATDAALVVRPFAVTKNDEYRYTGRNPVQQMAASLPLDSGQPSVALYISNAALRRAQRENLECHGAAAQPRDDVDYRPFLSAAGREGFLSLAELTGCQFAVIAASEAAALPRGRATPVCGLAPRNPPALFEKTLTPANGDYRLVRLANAVPDASLFTRWTATTDDALFAEAGRQARRGLSRMSLPVVGAGQTNAATAATADNSAVAADVAPRRARVRAVMGLRGMRRTVVETDSEADAFLLLHRRFEARNGAWVDGVAAPQYRAGLDETAVFVPAGRHEVVLSSARRSSSWAAVMALVLAAYAFGLVLEGARG